MYDFEKQISGAKEFAFSAREHGLLSQTQLDNLLEWINEQKKLDEQGKVIDSNEFSIASFNALAKQYLDQVRSLFPETSPQEFKKIQREFNEGLETVMSKQQTVSPYADIENCSACE